MSFVTSSTEDTSVKNSLTDSSLLQFIHTGMIADNHIDFYLLLNTFYYLNFTASVRKGILYLPIKIKQ